jgi:hypothetical protein
MCHVPKRYNVSSSSCLHQIRSIKKRKKEKKKTTPKKKKKLASDKNSGDSLESPLHGSVKVNWDSVVDRHKIKISISVVVRDSMSEVLPMLSEPKIT